MANIAIMGSGAFGTALAILCQRCGHQVSVWSRSPAELQKSGDFFCHKKLPNIEISKEITFSTDLSCIADSELLILDRLTEVLRQKDLEKLMQSVRLLLEHIGVQRNKHPVEELAHDG